MSIESYSLDFTLGEDSMHKGCVDHIERAAKYLKMQQNINK
jgi:hypothetical protein